MKKEKNYYVHIDNQITKIKEFLKQTTNEINKFEEIFTELKEKNNKEENKNDFVGTIVED